MTSFNLFFRDSLIPAKYHSMSIDNFIVTDINKDAFEKAKEWVNNDRGLFLYGDCGTGKTHLAVALAFEYMKLGKRIQFIPVVELIYELRKAFDDRYLLDQIIQYHAEKVLIFDDLGTEKTTDFTIECMDLIFDKRYRNIRNKFIATSNFSLSMIAQKLSDRIASRICEMCDVVKLQGDDFRLKSKLTIGVK